MLQKLALTQEDFIELQAYCKTVGIGFLSTPFDLDSIAFLEKLDMDFWKLPSGEITNLPYLEAIGRTGRDIVMSTGMCNMQEFPFWRKVEQGRLSCCIAIRNTRHPIRM
jgi:N,N'-diacetyllegionaminate synthase